MINNKLILQQTVKMMLQEAAKTSTELPDDVYITIVHNKNYRGIAAWYSDKNQNASSIVTGEVSAQKGQLPKHKQADGVEEAFSVQEAHADHGWGPLLYDVIIEFASKLGSYTTHDVVRGTVTDAGNIWKHYYYNRNDVEKIPMNGMQTVRGQQQPHLFALYAKSPNVLDQLKSMGRLLTKTSVIEKSRR